MSQSALGLQLDALLLNFQSQTSNCFLCFSYLGLERIHLELVAFKLVFYYRQFLLLGDLNLLLKDFNIFLSVHLC